MKNVYGNNAGYINYSQSVRSAKAKSDGKYPKTLFKKIYGVSEKIFLILLEREIIINTEWHHTSMYGNKTKFYSINNEILFYYIKGDKKRAFEMYKETRNYEFKIHKNRKKNLYNQSITFREGEEVDKLLAAGEKPRRTKSGFYCFKFDKKNLAKPAVRIFFKVNYTSKNIVQKYRNWADVAL